MLPEPDLFSGSHIAGPTTSFSLKRLFLSRTSSLNCETGQEAIAGEEADHGHDVDNREEPHRGHEVVLLDGENILPSETLETFSYQEKELIPQERGVKCFSNNNWGFSYLVAKDMQTTKTPVILNPSERKAGRWYLTVIVLLYVGLVTSFCLNVSLLLKIYPEPVASVLHLPQQPLKSDDLEGEMIRSLFC